VSRASKDFDRLARRGSLGLFLALTSHACLEVDPNFVGAIATNGHVLDDSSTSTTSAATGEDGTQDSTALSESENTSSTDASQTSQDTSTPSEDSSTLSESSTSTSDATVDSSSSDTSSDTSASGESSTSTTEVAEQIYALRVDNRATGARISNISSLTLTFDHASMVALGADAQGRDLRIVYTDDANNRTILPRTIDFESDWNRANTTIWFGGWGSISDTEIDTTHFTLEIDESSLTTDDPDGVFRAWDDFENPAVTQNKWLIFGNGTWNNEITAGSMYMRISPIGNGANTGISMYSGHRGLDLRFDYKIRQNIVGDSLDCRFGIPAGLSTTNGGKVVEGTLLGEGSLYAYHDDGIFRYTDLIVGGLTDWSFHTYSLLFAGPEVYNGQDNFWLDSHPRAVDPETNFIYPYVGIEMPARCGAIDTFELEIQWMRVRQGFYFDPLVEII
jgi:hypothetical protein